MCANEKEILNEYEKYLKRLIETESEELFSNGGLKHASILMSLLFDNTQNEVRLFCNGFKPDLITTEPYFSSLRKYLSDRKKSLSLLVEVTDYVDKDPFKLLINEKKNRGGVQDSGNIVYKQISEEAKNEMFKGRIPFNFAVFDDKRYRFEFDPKSYKAVGSFNSVEKCRGLIGLFDKAFETAKEITPPFDGKGADNCSEQSPFE